MKLPMHFIITCLPAIAGLAQPNDTSDFRKVEYINKNFYKLYSADFKNALELTQWAAQTAQKHGWKEQEAFALMGWGVVTYLGGDYANVLPRYLRALEIFEALNHKAGIVAVNNEMAVFYHKQNDLTNCFRSLDRAEKLAREIGDLEKLGTNLGHRGAILLRRERYQEAKPYFLEVYDIRKKTNDSVGLGYVLLDLAELAAHDRDFDQAILYVDQSSDIRSKIGDRYGLAVNAVTKGELYKQADNIPLAIQWLESGLLQAKEVGFTDLVQHTYKNLAEIYKQNGNFEKAYHYLTEYNLARDSLFNVEKAKAISELQTRYETEKKEIELAQQKRALTQSRWLTAALAGALILVMITLWSSRQQILARQKQRLAMLEKDFQQKLTESVINQQETDRARLARDLHDGLGQMISAVQLCLQQTTKSSYEQAADLLQQMHREIRNVVFELLPRTLSEEGLVASLHELANRLNASEKIRVNVNSRQHIRPDARIELTLYRVGQEWINNILKHARATVISVYLNEGDGKYTLTIEDNGQGFDPKILNTGSGNGWKNIQSRTRLLHGEVFVDSSPGRMGSTFIVSIPQTSLRQIA